MKVGILSLPFEPNYGWAVQLWALYHTIEQLGHEPVIIDRRWNATQSGLLYNIKRFIYYKGICGRFSSFLNNEIASKTPVVRDSETMTQISSDLDAIVVGSDQVWRIEHTRGADLNFFFDFVKEDTVKRISYAASFGKDTWQGTPEETARVKELLAKFSTITVREDTGVALCKELFDANATNVLDPTLLLTKGDYNSVLSTPRLQSILTTYILDSTEEKTNTINKISKDKNLNVTSLFPKKRVTYYKSVYYWLETIRDAKYVIVDSFHGMVFSIIFHKNFAVMANSKRGLTRFTSLLSQLGLEDRLTSDYSYESINRILTTEIDYNLVDCKLNEMRSYSLAILKDSLS
mgnify:FL=1